MVFLYSLITFERPVGLVLVALCFALLLPIGPGTGRAAATEAAWDALPKTGVVGLMRHAYAPGTGDPAQFRLGDCSTQRNLNQEGRDQARAVGAALREHGFVPERVFSSQWCRCLETAELLDVGPVQPLPAANSFFGDRSRGPAQTAELRAFLADLPEDEPHFLVTHQVNITALTGRPVSSGEIIFVDVATDGDVVVVAEIFLPY